jgi:pimeloyl-ACP methyl ester carboxylesterase
VLELGYHNLLYMPGTFVVAHATVVAVVLTALGLANPKLRSDFEETMNHMLAAIEYFRIGFARNMTTGRFYDLYDDLCKATDRYDRVNVMGYSFGALVALDALFYTRGVDQTRTDRLGDLITIGAPITLAQNFWPKHFDTIYANFSPGGDHQWINAQCALDVLAAPILDRPPDPIIAAGAAVANVAKQKGSWAARRPAELARQTTDVSTDPGDPNNINFSRKINLDYSGWYPLDLNVPEFFSLAAIRAHAMYWTPRSEPAYNAFDRIAPQLLRVRVPQ